MHIKLSKEQRERLIEEVQNYFELERGEQLGELAAEQLLSFMLDTIGPSVYNYALQDARKMLGDRFLAIEDELYAMEQRQERR